MRPRLSNCNDRFPTMRYELSPAVKRRMARARMPRLAGIKSQCSRFDALRVSALIRLRLNDGNADVKRTFLHRNVGVAAW